MKSSAPGGRWAQWRPEGIAWVLSAGSLAVVGCSHAPPPVPAAPPLQIVQVAQKAANDKPATAAQPPEQQPSQQPSQTKPVKKKGSQKKPPQKRKPTAQKNTESEPKPDARPADDSPSKSTSQGAYETIKLAHGQEVHVEKWGDTFEAYEYRPPVDLNDRSVEEVVWYYKTFGGGGGGPEGIQLDLANNKLYWAHSRGSHPDGRIIHSTLDGKQVKFLVEGLLHPHDLKIDVKRQRMYWLEGDAGFRPAYSLKAANLDGQGVKAIAEGLNNPMGLAFDDDREELYFWEEPGRVVRVKTDGTGLEEIIDIKREPSLRKSWRGITWNPHDQKLYWMSASGVLRRVAPASGAVKELVNAAFESGLSDFVIVAPQNEVIFAEPRPGQVSRVRFDGSEREVLVTAPPLMAQVHKGIGSSMALDEQHGMVYFSGVHYQGSEAYASIYRMKLPPPLKRSIRPAPPSISGLTPDTVKAGQTLIITGKYLENATAVTFVDDSTCEHRAAKFHADDDYALKVAVPKLSDQCSHPLIIVETPSGVTMTLRKDLIVPKLNLVYVHDRFKFSSSPQFWLAGADSHISKIESAVVFVSEESHFQAGEHGKNTIFIKNGCLARVRFQRDGIIYHEPFVRMTVMQEKDPTLKMHAVPAIRPSFLDKPLTYEQ